MRKAWQSVSPACTMAKETGTVPMFRRRTSPVLLVPTAIKPRSTSADWRQFQIRTEQQQGNRDGLVSLSASDYRATPSPFVFRSCLTIDIPVLGWQASPGQANRGELAHKTQAKPVGVELRVLAVYTKCIGLRSSNRSRTAISGFHSTWSRGADGRWVA